MDLARASTHGSPEDRSFPATLTLSFDTELIWGSFNEVSPREFDARYPDVRATIKELLKILERYEVSATWAVVGHLFLRQCQRAPNALAHPDLARPVHSWHRGDWYARDPCSDMSRDPLWYGEDILDLIQGAATPQEVGCHSFGHIEFGDPLMTKDAVDSDLDACLSLAARRGVVLRSFVFPKNIEGFHDSIASHGFTSFRGAGADPFAHFGRAPSRAGHFLANALGTTPPVKTPTQLLPGLWNLPGSALLMHRSGPRRLIRRAARLHRLRGGIREAQRRGALFHVWTHPFNLANDPSYLLGLFEEFLIDAAKARSNGTLLIENMGEVAARLGPS